jgi:hypothetical protein
MTSVTENPASAATSVDPRLSKCDRLPARAPYSHKILLLVEWHIAKDTRDAAKLLRSYYQSKRSSSAPFVPKSDEAPRTPYCD